MGSDLILATSEINRDEWTSFLYNRSLKYDTGILMTGMEFVKRAKRHAKRAGKECRFDPRPGKGSHGMLYVGDRRTTVKRGELAASTFRNMLKQLNIPKEDF